MRLGGLVLFLLSCGGCFESDSELTLAADGSGTQSMRLQLSERALGTLRGAVQAVDAAAPRADPLDVFDAAKVRPELADAGLELLRHQTQAREGGRAVDLQVRFKELAALRGNPLTGGARATWSVTRGAGADEVRLVYFPQGQDAWRHARDTARALAQEPDATVQHFVQSRLAQIDGLDISFTLSLPGDVIAHTANLRLLGKRKVVAAVKASDIRSATDLLVRLAPRYEVVFTCKGFPLLPAANANPLAAGKVTPAAPTAARCGR
jgi:hypothetical protein